ncbi:MAG: hypothetical protein AAF761_06930 [Pseudomonadota bacterium]
MSIVNDMTRAWVAPREVMRRQMAIATEPRNLMLTMLACLLAYVARLPEIAAIAVIEGDDAATRQARFGALFVSQVLMGPLVLYLFAGIAQLAWRAFGGQGLYRDARLAIAWAAVVASPLVLIGGAFKVFAPNLVYTVAIGLTGVVFLWQWVVCLGEAQRAPAGETVQQS